MHHPQASLRPPGARIRSPWPARPRRVASPRHFLALATRAPSQSIQPGPRATLTRRPRLTPSSLFAPAMPSILDSYSESARCWFADKDRGWISGHVASKTVDGDNVTLAFVDENGKVSAHLLSRRARRGSEHPLFHALGRMWRVAWSFTRSMGTLSAVVAGASLARRRRFCAPGRDLGQSEQRRDIRLRGEGSRRAVLTERPKERAVHLADGQRQRIREDCVSWSLPSQPSLRLHAS